MGRHREDSSSLSNPHTEGNSSLHLPAFDTMMRVLSFASSSEVTEKLNFYKFDYISTTSKLVYLVISVYSNKAFE